MTATRWDPSKLSGAVRDLVSFGIGAYWGNFLIHQPAGQTEPWAWALAAAMMNLPVVAYLDRKLTQRRPEARSDNGTGPADRERTST